MNAILNIHMAYKQRRRIMKTVVRLFAVLVMLSLAVSCGSGSGGNDNNNNDTTQPAANSAKSLSATSKLMDTVFNAVGAAGQLNGAPAMIIKGLRLGKQDEAGDINCTCNSDDPDVVSVTCEDADGGTCTMTGTYNESTATVTSSITCDNFKPDETTTIDGSATLTAVAHMENAPQDVGGEDSQVVSGGSPSKAGGDDSCNIEDDDEAFGENDYCTLSDNALCAEAASVVAVSMTIGNDGFTVVDECGTYVFGSDFALHLYVCVPSAYVVTATYTRDGTFQGETLDDQQSYSCDYSELASGGE
jgi:hypothetical protein